MTKAPSAMPETEEGKKQKQGRLFYLKNKIWPYVYVIHICCRKCGKYINVEDMAEHYILQRRHL